MNIDRKTGDKKENWLDADNGKSQFVEGANIIYGSYVFCAVSAGDEGKIFVIYTDCFY
jgi:hypothetical protein